jgi:hypothetical protein
MPGKTAERLLDCPLTMIAWFSLLATISNSSAVPCNVTNHNNIQAFADMESSQFLKLLHKQNSF